MSAESALTKIRVEVGKKRIRVNDRFADFDKLRSGVVTRDQFRRCLATMQVTTTVTDAELNALEAAFPSRDGRGVQYQSFSEAVSSADPPAELTSSLRAPPQALPQTQEATIDRTNRAVLQQVLAAGLDVRSFFADFDIHHCGKVTAPQFRRCFPFRCDPAVMDALVSKYSDGQGNVLYHGWCEEINALKAAATSPTRPTTKGSQEGSLNGTQQSLSGVHLSVADLIAIIREQAAAHRLRFEDALQDFDKQRSGLITAAQFSSAVGRVRFVRFSLTQDQLDAIAKAYGTIDASGVLRVQYQAFLRDVTPHPGTAPASPTRLKTIPSTQGDPLAQSALQKVRTAVATRRFNMRPLMHDFDRAIKGIFQTRTCTKQRFLRALTVHLHGVILPEEAELLAVKYSVLTADGRRSEDVNYYQFCCDVEQGAALESAGRSHTTLLPVGHGFTELTNAGEIVGVLGQQCATKNVRLSEFLKDFDPLRGGTVQKDRLRTAISIAGLGPFSDKEIQILMDEYASTSRVPGNVDAARFLHDVDAACTSLQASGGTGVLTLTGTSSQALLKSLPSQQSNETSTRLADILGKLRDAVKHRNILLTPVFADYDKHHSWRVSNTNFKQALTRHRLPVSESDATLLCQVYADPNAVGSVLYRAFIGDIDESENIETQLKLRSDTRRAVSPVRSVANLSLPQLAEDTVGKICSFVARRNVRIEEFFIDADALRHRAIPASRFRGALAVLGLHLTEEELQSVERLYATDRVNNGFDYMAFSAEITHRVTVKAYPTLTTTAFASGSGKPNPDVANVVERLRKFFACRRLQLRPAFQDYDKLRKGTITETQFFATMSSLGGAALRLETREMAQLRQEFGESGQIRYPLFCDVVDNM